MKLESTGWMLKALDFAARKHRDQRRKDVEASPYINHPIAIVHLLWNTAGVQDMTVIVGALLHDTVEDTDTTFEELTQEFGSEVAALVGEVTDDKSLPKQTRKQLQIAHAPHLSDRAKLIKLADKISNLRDMVHSPPSNWSQERRREYFEWAKSVVDQIANPHPVLKGLFEEVYQQGIARFEEEKGSGNG
ncbi:MAG: HD domain-containing protein [Leptolyngbyaceae cyanobacterium bins.59]|nr:HD domain-containing protein [Leptolyngbyaceae cyanobacterium bins.59]